MMLAKVALLASVALGSCAGAGHLRHVPAPPARPSGTTVPVADPGQWDPTMYCRTVQPPDPWCKAHGH